MSLLIDIIEKKANNPGWCIWCSTNLWSKSGWQINLFKSNFTEGCTKYIKNWKIEELTKSNQC